MKGESRLCETVGSGTENCFITEGQKHEETEKDYSCGIGYCYGDSGCRCRLSVYHTIEERSDYMRQKVR